MHNLISSRNTDNYLEMKSIARRQIQATLHAKLSTKFSPANARLSCGLILWKFFQLFTSVLLTDTLDRVVGKCGILGVSGVAVGFGKAFKKTTVDL